MNQLCANSNDTLARFCFNKLTLNTHSSKESSKICGFFMAFFGVKISLNASKYERLIVKTGIPPTVLLFANTFASNLC